MAIGNPLWLVSKITRKQDTITIVRKAANWMQRQNMYKTPPEISLDFSLPPTRELHWRESSSSSTYHYVAAHGGNSSNQPCNQPIVCIVWYLYLFSLALLANTGATNCTHNHPAVQMSTFEDHLRIVCVRQRPLKWFINNSCMWGFFFILLTLLK